MHKILKPSFFKKYPTTQIAKNLLGKFLVRKIGSKKIEGKIIEVEVYDGLKDKGSHASRGKTKRNYVMFGKAGCWYVYLNYGMHWMLNIVTQKENYPAAILIRAIDKIKGPGKLTKFLKINKSLNGKIALPTSGLWIEDRGIKIKASQIKKGPRIGIDYAGKYWSKRHLRFWIE